MSSKIETTAGGYSVAATTYTPSPISVPTGITQDMTAPSVAALEAKQKMEDSLKQMVAKEANRQDLNNFDLSFGIDQATQRVYAQVKDATTGEVIRQIPSQEFLDMMARIRGAVDGLFLDANG